MQNRNSENKTIKTLIIVAVIVLLGVGVAYAALSASLTITFNKVTQSALSWNVAFTGSTVTPTVAGTSDTGRLCGNATVTPTSVSVADTSVSKPGDKCTYELTVRNSGTVTAKLSSITPTAPTGTGVTCDTATNGNMVCGNISYKLATDAAGTTDLALNSTITPSTNQTIYLIISYVPTDTVDNTSVTQSNAKFTLSYNQA